MKFAIFFCLVALSCVAQAELKPRNIFGLAKDQLLKQKEALDNILNAASDKLKEIVDGVISNFQKIINLLNDKAQEANREVYKLFEKFLNTLDVIIQEITNYNGKADLTACKKMADTAKNAITETIKSGGQCFVDKINEAKELMKNASSEANTGFSAILAVREQAIACIKKAEGWFGPIQAGGCIAAAASQATWTALTQIPSIGLEISKMMVLGNTLIPSLSVCVPQNSLLTALKQSQNVVENVKQCVEDKIKEVNEKVSEIPSLAGDDKNGGEASKEEELDKLYDDLMKEDFEQLTPVGESKTEATKVADDDNDELDDEDLNSIANDISDEE